MRLKNRHIHSCKFRKEELSRRKLYSQLENEYGKIVYSYTTHLKELRSLNYKEAIIGNAVFFLSIAISAVAIILRILTEYQEILLWTNVFFSILVTGLATYLKIKNYGGKSLRHNDAQNELWKIRESYLSLLCEFELLSTDEITIRHKQLLIETNLVYKLSPQASFGSYNEARRSLRYDEEQYFTRNELNSILPEALRK